MIFFVIIPPQTDGGGLFMLCLNLGGPRFHSRPSKTKDFKRVVEVLLSNAQSIKGSSM